MDSCPKELEPYDKAHKQKLIEQDYLQHLWWGNYGVSAVSVSVEHCLAGRKAKSKFIEKPMLQEFEEQKKELTEEELKKQRELFVARLEAMKTNFELNHPKKEGE